jgi:hypothetical protein
MILAHYRGNSSPGQLEDSSGAGNTLTVFGVSVPNPASPTPPEGDRWLVGPSIDGESRLRVPVSVPGAMLLRGTVEGDFISSLGTEPNRAVDDVLFSFNGAPDDVAPKFFGVLDSTGPLGQIRIYFFQVSPILLFADYFFADAGAQHNFKYEWSVTGTRLYLDGLLVASSATAPVIPTISLDLAGWEVTGNSHAMDYGYMDNVIFSDGTQIESGQIEGGDIEGGAIEGGAIE